MTSLWEIASSAGMSRRRFVALLSGGGAGAVLAGCAPSVEPVIPRSDPAAPPADPQKVGSRRGPIVKPTPESDFILRGGANAETRLERVWEAGLITPSPLFFVRSHGATPFIDAKTWRLVIEGSGAEGRLEVGYDDLLKMPSKTVTRSIDCAGNGRSFYEDLLGKKAEGDPWRLGAYGVAEWTGVPLSELLGRAGIKKSAVDVMPVGLDGAKAQRPMPVAKAMEEDTLLAYRMNGQDLPVDHGFPARVVAPGWAGVASIKWVGRIEVSEEPLFVKMNTMDYVLIGPDYPPRPPADGPPVTEQVLKSAVALPWRARVQLQAGRLVVRGYAWSPRGAIARVDVSIDGGRTSHPAKLVGPNLERAGVRWELSVEASPGEVTITPRATDERGNAQPSLAEQRWNKKGYLFGAAVPHPVTVVPG
jgi:DMSO/TMAO reductase YedYZ molybdopterin-dependent catalytic subunit